MLNSHLHDDFFYCIGFHLTVRQVMALESVLWEGKRFLVVEERSEPTLPRWFRGVWQNILEKLLRVRDKLTMGNFTQSYSIPFFLSQIMNIQSHMSFYLTTLLDLGMQVLEWNGVPLMGKTYEEVQRIMGEQCAEVELCLRL